ncbi:MAG: RdgB/HAM1 family non-canonical purine NTP pyrophosphatase [Thaumarchaeota archaeon]|nr:RdgB/HAM1 family non-canonical purine NTP pyrophosphatase [Nitrososphaerota archaeon]
MPTRTVSFATSNEHKFREAALILSDFGLSVTRIAEKGTEIQSDNVGAIAAFAARQTSSALGLPLVVEDTGLFIDSLDGFPGPYASPVYKKMGLGGVLLLLKNESNRGARFESGVAFCEPEKEAKIFVGSLEGSIAKTPAGVGGFGFDPIFIPEGSDKTLAELSLDEKCSLSHRGKALGLFAKWYLAR